MGHGCYGRFSRITSSAGPQGKNWNEVKPCDNSDLIVCANVHLAVLFPSSDSISLANMLLFFISLRLVLK